MRTLYLVFTLLLIGSHTPAQTLRELYGYAYAMPPKVFETTDKTYEPFIRTVQLYPALGTNTDRLQPPIVPIGGALLLEFDDINERQDNYLAKIIHCNHDWQPSQYSAMDYMFEYNEYNLNSYEASVNTRVPYIHYTFPIPRVKVSGNYIVKVYRNSEEDLILTRRFVIFEQGMLIQGRVEPVIGATSAFQQQQVSFQANYQAFDLINPQENVTAVIRQNQRWDNARTNLRALYVREFQKNLDFQYFGLENAFLGGNEFRLIDFRSFMGGGWGVRRFNPSPEIVRLETQVEKPRAGRVYNVQVPDLNGKMLIDILERPGRGKTDADYAEVSFVLDAQGFPVTGDVYVTGSFNDFQIEPHAKMKLDNGIYYTTLLLKQGIYDYQFSVLHRQNRDDLALEGSFSQTQNDYEVLLYYREPGRRGDRVIGYQRFAAPR